MHTNPSRTLLLRASAVGAIVLAATACGGGSDSTSDSSADSAAGGDPILGQLLGGKSFEDAELEVQQHVQECMTALGWEYTAVAPQGDITGQGDTSSITFDSDAFAAESGYGISTAAGGAGIEVGSGGVGATGAGGDDPNFAYVDSLSEDERAAYYEDLFGPPSESLTMELGGCSGEANDAVYGEGAFTQIDDMFSEVDARVEADSRIIAAFGEWATCMSDAGYAYSKPADPYDDFTSRLQALGAQPDPAALEALQQEEIATAQADRACAKQADLDKVQQEVFTEISEQVASES